MSARASECNSNGLDWSVHPCPFAERERARCASCEKGALLASPRLQASTQLNNSIFCLLLILVVPSAVAHRHSEILPLFAVLTPLLVHFSRLVWLDPEQV